MKRTIKKLNLNSEFVRVLSGRQLAAAAGGDLPTWGAPISCAPHSDNACVSDMCSQTCGGGGTTQVTNGWEVSCQMR